MTDHDPTPRDTQKGPREIPSSPDGAARALAGTHTPLPWTTQGVANPTTNPRMSLWGPRKGLAESGEWIAKDIRPENVRFILRAVNAHEELLAACRAAGDAIFARGLAHEDDGPFNALLIQLAAAISKAEGRL